MNSHILVGDESIVGIKQRLRDCLKLLETYQWIIDSFVLDFFIDSHWPHLPAAWKATLSNCTPTSLASLLDPDTPAEQNQVWPLSLMAFKQAIHALALNRKQVDDFKFVKSFIKTREANNSSHVDKKLKEDPAEGEDSASNAQIYQPQSTKGTGKFEFYEEMLSVFSGHHSSLKHIFRKHVKPKKQYELARLGKFANDCMSDIGVNNLIDVGAGMGHLARYLCYAHNLQVACVDSNNDFTDSANKFDKQLEESVRKLENKGDNVLALPPPPVHVNAYLDPEMDLKEFHSILSEKFHITDTALKYGIMGLHTCGDLGPVLIKMFVNDSKASILHSVGCCYMKIEKHFPMSTFLNRTQTHWKLTYTNAELACHAIEMYAERLRKGEQNKLKVHCYRAVLERLLVNKDPTLRHSILMTVKRAHELSFLDYAVKATSKLPIEIDPSEFTTPQIEKELCAWWEVVTYYTIRLALAPILETVILLDRCVYLYENGFSSLLIPLFDPSLSPRNQIVFSIKK